MNGLDLLVVGLAGLAALRGWRKGLLGQAFELGGGFLGLVAGVALGGRVAEAFVDRPGFGSVLVSLAVVLVALTVGQALGFVVGHRFGAAVHRANLGAVNASLGSVFGIAITLVSFWLVGSLLVGGPWRPVARAVRSSAVLHAVNAALPRPPDVLAQLRQYLDTSGFPQVFAGLPRPVGPPVDLPSGRVAARAAAAADDSTVRVIVPACGGTQLGTGWVAAPGVVVTNAHVVAGGDEVTIRPLEGGDVAGTVVLFDPDTDLAVVRADGLDAAPLDLVTRALEPGTGGATLGYPGARGGTLVSHRAAVQARYEPLGRDVYGRSEVRREVYELRSPVRQGDSGGPFVVGDGDVAGVVFAASTTDAGTGYALTGAEVSDEVRRGTRTRAEVTTGPCTH